MLDLWFLTAKRNGRRTEWHCLTTDEVIDLQQRLAENGYGDIVARKESP